jgi:hypothetical protein
MFEFIGIAFVCWFAFIVIRGIIRGIGRAKGSQTSTEYGREARRIATQELGIPNTFYNYITTNHIEEIKEAALMLREKQDCEKTSWPRLLALCIYAFFHIDCKEFLNENANKKRLFTTLKIDPQVIINIAMQDPNEIRINHS